MHKWCIGKECKKMSYKVKGICNGNSLFKKIMKLLTDKQQEPSYPMQKYVIFVKTNLKMNMVNIKIIVKLRIIVIIKRNIEVLHIAYVI